MGGLGILRGIMLALGGVALVGGLLLVLAGGTDGVASGIWLIVTGSVVLLAVVFERTRTEASTRSGLRASRPGRRRGAGLAAGAAVPAPDEVFVDPTSRRRMRVWLDRSGGSGATGPRTDGSPRAGGRGPGHRPARPRSRATIVGRAAGRRPSPPRPRGHRPPA